MIKGSIWVVILTFSVLVAFCGNGREEKSDRSTKGMAVSFDGVEIVYSIQGKNEPALVFIHGGFADRTFWPDQMKHFGRYRKVLAIDLAGHGESGKNRKDWSVDTFAEDVSAVIRKEKITKAVLIGNSLGAPVCIKTAHLIPEAIMAIVAVDTLQVIGMEIPSSYFLEMAKAFRDDFAGTMKKMVHSLFHPDTYPELMAWAEKRMLNHSPEMAATFMESYVDFDMAKLIKNINIPIRCINGDLIPTQVEKNRGIHADFDAVILPNTGHYPMLENPELFNQHLEKILKELDIK
jgi:pimeloyl-ACP methyl ester carboxylesterase